MPGGRIEGFTRIELLLTVAIVILLGALAVTACRRIQAQHGDTTAISSCKQIILALKVYAKDHEGHYPDSVPAPSSGTFPASSNDAFRELVKSRIVTEERIFGNPGGVTADGLLGEPLHFAMAVSINENHWAMTRGLTDASTGNAPLVFEHSAENSWPPKWLPARTKTPSRKFGLARKGHQLIIGNNDGSVIVEKLVEQKGLLLPKKDSEGLDIFTRTPQGSVLAPIITGPIICQ